MRTIDHTHDPAARSWVASANAAGTDFPVQNLPFGIFRRRGSGEAFRAGVAIGSEVLDLGALAATGAVTGEAAQALQACTQARLNAFLAMGPAAWRALRHALFALLHEHEGAAAAPRLRGCLLPQHAAEHALPVQIGDYTDFYTSIHHARTISRLLDPAGELPPNFQWVPTAYHGRVSSIGVSGQTFRRPWGQSLPAGAATPRFAPCARLDYELELAIYIGVGNAQGEPIALQRAEDHVFGIGLLNDWSARDLQFWEMKPLGPFHAKNFATTLSPWIVTLDALAPFRTPWTRPADDPQPLAYLDGPANRQAGGLGIQLEVALETARMRAAGRAPHRLSTTSFSHHYWSVAQMVTHHAAGGCNLQPGDLLGSGTVSGPVQAEAGALIELAMAGSEPVQLPDGEQRSFLHDGDAIVLRGWCTHERYVRIGLGSCRGLVEPAHSAAWPA
ncbi:fumarylacetoacetase [Pseudorhodoferax sp.]|uniref:fumarylacetoacetase n=1 Tax=Pseudorhodoferax sp. TaxID=1993553 RepID=UPI002DD633AF|nr:fumarylacetoacetase [Pseudorhodoferax sp.]